MAVLIKTPIADFTELNSIFARLVAVLTAFAVFTNVETLDKLPTSVPTPVLTPEEVPIY